MHCSITPPPQRNFALVVILHEGYFVVFSGFRALRDRRYLQSNENVPITETARRFSINKVVTGLHKEIFIIGT